MYYQDEWGLVVREESNTKSKEIWKLSGASDGELREGHTGTPREPLVPGIGNFTL
jgi:hypothetical protein